MLPTAQRHKFLHPVTEFFINNGVTMKGRIWLLSSSLAVLALIGTPSRAKATQDPGCRAARSYCSTGDQCCSQICERNEDGHSYCT